MYKVELYTDPNPNLDSVLWIIVEKDGVQWGYRLRREHQVQSFFSKAYLRKDNANVLTDTYEEAVEAVERAGAKFKWRTEVSRIRDIVKIIVEWLAMDNFDREICVIANGKISIPWFNGGKANA